MLFGKKYGKYRTAELLYKFHIGVVTIGALLFTYFLLICIAILDSAITEFSKYRDLGFSYTFHHFLQDNGFYQQVMPFLCIGMELLHYILQSLRVKQRKKNAGGIWVFGILLVVHIAMWLHAETLSLPDLPAWELVDLPAFQYCRISKMTVWPSIVYFVMYALNVRVSRLPERREI